MAKKEKKREKKCAEIMRDLYYALSDARLSIFIEALADFRGALRREAIFNAVEMERTDRFTRLARDRAYFISMYDRPRYKVLHVRASRGSIS